MQVTITFDSGDSHTITPSAEAAALIPAAFNPSGKIAVDTIKNLAAALVTEMGPLKATNATARHASLAITAFEEGAMWAVKAATA